MCLSGGQETQETNDVNSVPPELPDYCPVPRPRHSLGLCSALTVDCGAQNLVLTFTLRLQGTHSSPGRCRAAGPARQPCLSSISYLLTSYCVQLLEQQYNAVSAAFINLKLRGPQKLSGPRVHLAKLIPSVCVESCTKETWESSNRDLRCSLKISVA